MATNKAGDPFDYLMRHHTKRELAQLLEETMSILGYLYQAQEGVEDYEDLCERIYGEDWDEWL